MLLNVQHRTDYTYSEPVNYTIQQLRLTPQDGFGQRVQRWEVRVNGHLHDFEDTYGNAAHTLVLDTPHDTISIVACGTVETGLNLPPVPHSLPLEVYLRSTPLTQADGALHAFATGFSSDNMDAGVLEHMMHSIIQCVPYEKGTTAVETTAAKAFALGSGVCQDHAHIFISCCRSLGLPARYVSGYVFTDDGSLMESHAWADVWLEQSGWLSFDVSNRCRTNATHVRLAIGLDYREACAISGMRGGGGMETMGVSVLVNQFQQTQAQQ
jgi:transglutaminase-like putative cysteine protease